MCSSAIFLHSTSYLWVGCNDKSNTYFHLPKKLKMCGTRTCQGEGQLVGVKREVLHIFLDPSILEINAVVNRPK